ncbi:MAG: hypothetical protein HY059_20245 [Proteobacteria bacterium]|nr:hypothetical protein [Pseudomonadota bacterium]
MNHNSLARICYDAIRAYGKTISEVYLRWADAPPSVRESFSGAVAYLLEAPSADLADLHGHWLAARIQSGWQHGPQRDELRRLHPAMVPWSDVPERERLKFELMFRVVDVFRNHVVPRLKLVRDQETG